MGEVILRRIGDKSYAEPSSPEKLIEAKLDPPAVLGRGPVLKCPEKKISRNHATIDWDDDGVLITSTHVNPTFVIIKGKKKTLSEGQSAVLNNGDRFGLLKESYWYKVILTSIHSNVKEEITKIGNAKKKTKSKNMSETIEDTPSTGTTSSGTIQNDDGNGLSTEEGRPVIKESICSNNSEKGVHNSRHSNSDHDKIIVEQKDEMQKIENLSDKETSIDENDEDILEISATVNDRGRVLPKWLTSSKTTESSENVLKKAAGTSHGAKKAKTSKPPKPKPKPKQKQKMLEFSDESESESEQKSSPKKRTKMNKGSPQKGSKPSKKPNQYHTLSQDFDTPEMETEIPESKISPYKKREADDATVSNKATKATPATRKPAHNAAPEDKLHSVSDDDEESPLKIRNRVSDNKPENPTRVKVSSKDDADASENANKKGKIPRKSCEYGENCYRKTAKHRKEMAHPGDMDYLSSEDNPDDDDDDRPECEFGLNCYRKNPKHKKDFKHTAVLNPPRQAKRKAMQKRNDNENSDDDSENEYDFDDPFLNDDSTDDYAPTDSSGPDSNIEDAVEEDDTNRMLKEAKKFVKKRKH